MSVTRPYVENQSQIAYIGFWDYNDLSTQTTPIIVNADTDVYLTNDALGAFTNSDFKLNGIDNVWDTSTQEFSFSELSNGDMVDIRLDVVVTTSSPNQEVIINLEVAGGAYNIPFTEQSYKSAGEHPVNRYNGLYMGDDFTRLNSAKFKVRSDDDRTVVVNGWYCKVIKQGN